ncbi:MAG: hypothetical protein V1492_00505 [Candidatus Micrarchaeota archaeon]
MAKIKTLVVFYSRTGTTKKLAEDMAAALGCDTEELLDTRDRKGVMGYLLAGRDATLKSLTTLQPLQKDPAAYDLVLIGTPVWSFNISVPVRAYIVENWEKFRRVAFFCTQGSTGAENAFREMEMLCGKKPIAKLAVSTRDVVNRKYEEKLTEFIQEVSR